MKIGKPLSHRYALGALPEARAIASMTSLLASQAAPIVEVRKQGRAMVACVVARADEAAVRLCRNVGFAVKRWATVVFGLAGADAARMFPMLDASRRAWLEVPCAARETKVVLVDGGVAVLSIVAEEGTTRVTAAP